MTEDQAEKFIEALHAIEETNDGIVAELSAIKMELRAAHGMIEAALSNEGVIGGVLDRFFEYLDGDR